VIYFDNGATSYPKPDVVFREAVNGLRNYSFNSGRGGYAASIGASEKIYAVREKIADFVGAEPQNIAFTKNCTEALNMAIKGMVKKGDHVIISSLEHNAVFRPVYALYRSGYIDFDIADFSFDEDACVAAFERLIKRNTSLIVCTHASNVFGVLLPVKKIGAMAKRHNLGFVVDAAQSAGIVPVNLSEFNADAVCAPGHKGLYGAMGTGFIAVRNGLDLRTITEGGTGSESMNPRQPASMPDRLESGTLNNSGILSLGAGIDFINRRGMQHIYSHELALTDYIYNSLSRIENIKLYCPKPEKNKSVPLISFNYGDFSSEKTAAYLAERNIAVRAGLHCAPLAHKYFNTAETGTVRICPSAFTTGRECEILINTIKKLNNSSLLFHENVLK